MDHTEPTPPASWLDAEDFIEPDDFARMPKDAQAYVLRHWVWAREHANIHGQGLVGHHNWLKFIAAEEANGVEYIPGVTLNGHPIER